VSRKIVAFFCDECGVELKTGHVCPECKRVLCHNHYYGDLVGPLRRRDGFCSRCAKAKEVRNEETQQT